MKLKTFRKLASVILNIIFAIRIYVTRDVPVGVPLDLSTPTGMSCIGTYGENCKSDNISFLSFLLLWHGNLCHGKYSKLIINYLFYFLFSENSRCFEYTNLQY